MKAKILQVSDDLYLITLVPPIEGFEDFIGVWLYLGEISFLIDVGPSATAHSLRAALSDLQVSRLDFIFLTHIHLDHAGGIGEMADWYPDAAVIAHKAGLTHLADPARLWEGTLKTLGRTGELYGPIRPVPPARLIDAEQFRSGQISAIVTPGHAAHHVSYCNQKYLFAGETAGVHLRLPSGAEYLRPATPPRFFLDSALASLDALIARAPSAICFGHFGMEEHGTERLKDHRAQLLLWKDIIEEELVSYPDRENIHDHCLARLLQKDPRLAAFQRMDESVRRRETGFLMNSIKGYVEHLLRT